MLKLNKNKFFTLILTGLILTQFYQNCGQMGEFQVLDQSSTNLSLASNGDSDLNHPSASNVDLPTQKIQVVNRQYVAVLMREVFTTAAGPASGLEDLINKWIFNRGAQYGEGCNPYSTYSGRDCGGDITNANLPIRTSANTVRESFRIQFCQNILGDDIGLNALLEKIPNHNVAPTVETIKQVYGLFYRTEEPNDEVVNALVALDASLAKNQELLLERWRGLALQVCESSGWQLQ